MDSNLVNKIKDILFNDPEVKANWTDLVNISSFADFLKSFKLIFFFVKKLIYVIEIVQVEYSAMTKEQRIEYAAAVLDDLIVFRGWTSFLEVIDGFVFKLVISQVVAALDDSYGSGSWFNNLLASANIDPSAKLKEEVKLKFNS